MIVRVCLRCACVLRRRRDALSFYIFFFLSVAFLRVCVCFLCPFAIVVPYLMELWLASSALCSHYLVR